MYPEPTMEIGYSSPNDSKRKEMDSSTELELESSWWGQENQIGLEPGQQFGAWLDDEEVALDKKGDIKHLEAIAKYWYFS